MLKRRVINRPNRRAVKPAVPKLPTPISVTNTLIDTVDATFTTDLQFSGRGVPQIAAMVGGSPLLPVSVVFNTPTEFVLTYGATVAAATEFVVPNQDPGVRSYVGGYMFPGSIAPAV